MVGPNLVVPPFIATYTPKKLVTEITTMLAPLRQHVDTLITFLSKDPDTDGGLLVSVILPMSHGIFLSALSYSMTMINVIHWYYV
jgi:hypothetical protein